MAEKARRQSEQGRRNSARGRGSKDSMSAAELRRLKRPELLTIMLEQSMEIDRLQEELAKTRRQLEELQNSGQQQLAESMQELRGQVMELMRRLNGEV